MMSIQNIVNPTNTSCSSIKSNCIFRGTISIGEDQFVRSKKQIFYKHMGNMEFQIRVLYL